KTEEPKIEIKTITRPSRRGSRIVASKSSETGRRKAGKVSDGASVAFAEYLKQQSQEEQEQIKESIDRIVIDTRNGKK
ncbi:MAG: hypothetical protein IJY70_01540, partial [Clostridia bacterium]|nr:hypothetical protein [Clostridia bacterium]